MSAFSDLANTGYKEVYRPTKAPFGYPGGKANIVKEIVKLMPRGKSFVDVFGGAGTVLLNMPTSKVEVFNDINSGIVATYRCLRDREKFDKLAAWIDLTVHSREDWVFCRETWQDCSDDVERAGRWLYMLDYSFACMGRNFGNTRVDSTISGRLTRRISSWRTVHNRLRNVTIENLDFRRIFEKYDHEDAVFYCDPPYSHSDNAGAYSLKWDRTDDEALLSCIEHCKGSIVMSGYNNTLIDDRPFWTGRHEFTSLTRMGQVEDRHYAEEIIWIKEN